VEPIRNVMQQGEVSELGPPPGLRQAQPSRLSLPPKGACWYCDKPLDSVKRFCGRGCADAFDEEAEFSRT
jgi:hypothetical protein